MADTPDVYISLRLRPGLKRRIRIQAVYRDQTMSDFLRDQVEKVVEEMEAAEELKP